MKKQREKKILNLEGLIGYVEFLNQSKHPIHSKVFQIQKETNKINVEIAPQWNNSYYENVICFTNNISPAGWGHSFNSSVRHDTMYKQIS